MRKTWMSVAGVCAVALLAVQFAWRGGAHEAHARSRVPMAAPADEIEFLPLAPEREPTLLLGPDAPAGFHGAPTHRITTLAAA